MSKSFASELHEEWSKPVDECVGLLATLHSALTQGHTSF